VIGRDVLDKWLNEYLNVKEISDYLPNGIQIEGAERVEKIITAVSINLDIVKAAIEAQADTIIVHHGMFWNNEERTIKGYRRIRISEIVRNNINLFAFHLPLDVHPEISHNRLILKRMGADIIEDSKIGGNKTSIGLKGIFTTPYRFEKLVEKINEILNTKARFFHYGKNMVKTLYVVSGAGRNMIDRIPELEVDAYLTGDASESTEYIAKEERLNYIFAGHYNTEKLGIIQLGKIIAEKFKIEVHFIDLQNPL